MLKTWKIYNKTKIWHKFQIKPLICNSSKIKNNRWWLCKIKYSFKKKRKKLNNKNFNYKCYKLLKRLNFNLSRKQLFKSIFNPKFHRIKRVFHIWNWTWKVMFRQTCQFQWCNRIKWNRLQIIRLIVINPFKIIALEKQCITRHLLTNCKKLSQFKRCMSIKLQFNSNRIWIKEWFNSTFFQINNLWTKYN